MNDFIERQAAIDLILEDKIGNKSLEIFSALGIADQAIAVNMACDRHIQWIQKLPSVQLDLQPTRNQLATDTISRQAAINAIENTECELLPEEWNELTNSIMAVPSVEPEIIRCKECKHSELWYRDKRRCFLWHEEGIDVFEDGFCNYAERRTDGQTA